MTIEQAYSQVVPKPWGSHDLRPWSDHQGGQEAVGEIRFQRADARSPEPHLLLKLLFTNEPLSIQVHPNDAYAKSIGLANGKSEAWYVLSATPDAKIAFGLNKSLTPAQLRTSIGDGSIANLVQWRTVRRGDVISVPAGTIHAIGAGLVIVEIQQRSDATFRLFDFGRHRELHVDNAVGAADFEQTQHQAPPRQLSATRTLLVASPHFVLERVELPARVNWELATADETWIFTIAGQARIGSINTIPGEALFLRTNRSLVTVGSEGLSALVAYVGSEPIPDLLQTLNVDEPRH